MSKIVPQRTCIGCKSKRAKKDLIRIIVDNKKNAVIDLTGKGQGRGAYFCRLIINNSKFRINPDCLKKAIDKKAFNYAFKEKTEFINPIKAADCGGFGTC